jgi:DNA end-binding protein Ku
MTQGGARLRQRYVAEEGGDPASDIAPPATMERSTPLPVPASAGPPAQSRRLQLVESIEPAEEPEPEPSPAWVEPADMVKGYEFERGRFVLFDAEELKALRAATRQTIDIVSFIPQQAVDPIYYDKGYYLAPDKRGEKTYSLLLAALQASGRSALAKWAWRAKEYVVQIRPTQSGLVLQQLLYADEVRAIEELGIELVPVSEPELALALRLIEQLAGVAYDPSEFVDEEKLRILAAVEAKIAGRQTVAPGQAARPSGEIVDLMAALQASIRAATPAKDAKKRKPAKRAAVPVRAAESVAPVRGRRK